MSLIHRESTLIHVELIVAVSCIVLFVDVEFEGEHRLEEDDESHVELAAAEGAWVLDVLLSNLWPGL